MKVKLTERDFGFLSAAVKFSMLTPDQYIRLTTPYDSWKHVYVTGLRTDDTENRAYNLRHRLNILARSEHPAIERVEIAGQPTAFKATNLGYELTSVLGSERPTATLGASYTVDVALQVSRWFQDVLVRSGGVVLVHTAPNRTAVLRLDRLRTEAQYGQLFSRVRQQHTVDKIVVVTQHRYLADDLKSLDDPNITLVKGAVTAANYYYVDALNPVDPSRKLLEVIGGEVSWMD